jgi:phosphocarrier protein HPr
MFMTERIVTIQNQAGIHCRPSSEILLTVQKFPDCSFHVESKQGSADLNSMLALLGLGLCEGDTVTIRTDGENEKEACDVISALFAFNFDFPPNE